MPPTLLVCERTGRRAAALRAVAARREIQPALRIVETRSAAELERAVVDGRRRGAPAAMPVVELIAADVERVCELLARLVSRGDDAPLAVAADADAAALESIVRAAGANLFVASTRELDRIVDAYVEFAADEHRRPRPTDDERLPTARIWDALPWPTKSGTT